MSIFACGSFFVVIRSEREQIDDMIGMAVSSGHNKEKYDEAIGDCASRIEELLKRGCFVAN